MSDRFSATQSESVTQQRSCFNGTQMCASRQRAASKLPQAVSTSTPRPRPTLTLTSCAFTPPPRDVSRAWCPYTYENSVKLASSFTHRTSPAGLNLLPALSLRARAPYISRTLLPDCFSRQSRAERRFLPHPPTAVPVYAYLR
jgi:hypothetical protein